MGLDLFLRVVDLATLSIALGMSAVTVFAQIVTHSLDTITFRVRSQKSADSDEKNIYPCITFGCALM